MAITYEHKPIDWDNEGIEPTQDLIENGFNPGYKPPAEYFNAILNRTSAAITEIQEKTADLSVDVEAFTINNGITDGTCTYTAPDEEAGTSGGYTITADSAVQSADYFCIRFLAPNDYVSGATFTIGTTSYTAVNAGFKENDVVLLNFDRAQQKCFAVGGSSIEVDTALSSTSENPVQNKVINTELAKKVDYSTSSGTSVIKTYGFDNNFREDFGEHCILWGTSNRIGENITIADTIIFGYGNEINGHTAFSIILGNDNTISSSPTSECLSFGSNNTFEGSGGASIGDYNTLSGSGVSIGRYLTAHLLNFVVGKYSKTPTAASVAATTGDLFVVGNGLSSSKTNAFRVAADGNVYGTKAYTASGADYAEMFPWDDDNAKNEDRRGLFVTLDGDKIRLANADDDYILGVVSATPSVVADAHTDDWCKKWKTDIFGERLLDENGAWILNDDFKEEENESYVSRLDRKEWAAVGLVGKLIVVDDGTCEVNGYCKPKNGGVATKSEAGYRVMKRLDDTHIQILFR